MKLLQRFRKQASREDIEAQAAQELDAAMAKPVDIPAMTPAPGLPGDDLNGSATAVETAETGENGEALGSVADAPKRRPATARKTGATRATSTRTRSAATKARTSAKPAARSAKTPVRKPAAKPAAKKTSPAAAGGGTVKKRASASAGGGTTGRAGSARQPAAKKR